MSEEEIPIVDSENVEWTSVSRGDTFEFRGKRLGDGANNENLGCSLYEIPAGKQSWPYHYHTANEEAIYVLEGNGILRTPSGERDLSEGDYVGFQTGEKGSHQVANCGDDVLRYLCFSTMRRPDVVIYPDSDKIRAMTDTFEASFRTDAEVDYWEDEE